MGSTGKLLEPILAHNGRHGAGSQTLEPTCSLTRTLRTSQTPGGSRRSAGPVHDEPARLRFVSGDGAKELLESRYSSRQDEDFLAGMRKSPGETWWELDPTDDVCPSVADPAQYDADGAMRRRRGRAVTHIHDIHFRRLYPEYAAT